jgi:hypothetical protein
MPWFSAYHIPSRSCSKTADEHGFAQSIPQSHKPDTTGNRLFNLFIRFARDGPLSDHTIISTLSDGHSTSPDKMVLITCADETIRL